MTSAFDLGRTWTVIVDPRLLVGHVRQPAVLKQPARTWCGRHSGWAGCLAAAEGYLGIQCRHVAAFIVGLWFAYGPHANVIMALNSERRGTAGQLFLRKPYLRPRSRECL